MPKASKTHRSKRGRGTSKERGYDHHWRKISKARRSQFPVCEYCGKAPSTEVDHLVRFRSPLDPLRTQWDNLRATCTQCHIEKHAERGEASPRTIRADS